MTTLEHHIGQLFSAELQFRLASAVRLAVTDHRQPLDLPIEWTHGKHRVKYEQIALREDQADFAAYHLHYSAIYLMAVAMRDAIKAAIPDPKSSHNPDVRSAYQIARLIRNAFAHEPFWPKWRIDPDCRDKVFTVKDVITLNTAGLDGQKFDRAQYGGPLALLALCWYVRFDILGDKRKLDRIVPLPKTVYHQQGDLIFRRIDDPGSISSSGATTGNEPS